MSTAMEGKSRRVRVVVLLGLVVASFWSARVQAQSVEALSGDPAKGRQIVVSNGCIRCHSIWGNGGKQGPDFASVGGGRSLQQLAGLFWNHTPGMIKTVRQWGVEWPTFTEEELADVISYIYYVKLFDEPGDPAVGERWFREKRCVECHTVGGRGGDVGPNLDAYGQVIAPIVLAQGMWNHGPDMQAKQAAKGIPTPTFAGREIADIQAYIRQVAMSAGQELVFLQPPNPAAGSKLFETKGCRQCHGVGGLGTSLGPNLRTAIQQLRVSEIAGKLWNHSFQMSAAMRGQRIMFPRFRGNEMSDLVAFLYYLRFFDTGGSGDAGREVFQRSGCSSCHVGNGEPATGPDLSKSQATRTPLGLATAMWNHAPAMYNRAQSGQVEWPRFEGDDMRNLAVYLRQVGSDGRNE